MKYLNYIKGKTSPSQMRESYIKKHYPEFYNYLLDHYPQNLSFIEKLYWFYNNIKEHPICKHCGALVNFNGFTHGYYNYCSLKCSNSDKNVLAKKESTIIKNNGSKDEAYKERKEKAKQTKLERYGDVNYVNIEKQKQTNLERYGVECSLQDKEVQEKAKQAKLERYGDANYGNIEKRKLTCLERYGVEYTLQDKEVQEKAKQTKLERYGDPYYNNYKQIKETNLERYGVECSLQDKEVQEKAKQSMINHWGVRYAQQNPNIVDKSRISFKNNMLYKYDNILDINYDKEVEYICKCPHPECNKCQEKQYNILSKYYWIRRNNNIELCTKLLPIQVTHAFNTSIEIFVKLILDEYNIEYITNDRSVLDGYELDIYIPSKKIAIECNGIYWHSTKNKESKYHYNKFIKCKEKGIQLLTIWEDQIINKPQILRSIVLSKLGIYNYRLYARKCVIREVNAQISKDFLDNNHLQGNVNSSIKLGLYYNDELVSLMTFGKLRKCMNSSGDGYELYRYCNKLGTQVIGGASRLFKHFINQYNPAQIESFASNDISDGSLYRILNFNYIDSKFGSYWYIDKKMNRYHRYNFRKSELIKMGADKNLSESQIMDDWGYYKIFDTGQSKFIYKN